MILNRLLYSRSFSKDYRWVMTPAAQSPGEQEDIRELLGQLNEEYDLYDRSKGLNAESEGTLLFGKSVCGFGVLCRCGPTKYEDAVGRRIFALSGLLARHEEKKEFAAALPYLVALGEECLAVPVDLGGADADQIKNRAATQVVALDDLRAKAPATTLEWLRMPHIEGLISRELRSDDDGLKQLLRLLGSPLIPWVDFAFAAPAQLARRMGTFDVVVGDVGLSVSGVGRVAGARFKTRVQAPIAQESPPSPRVEKKRPRRKEKTGSIRIGAGRRAAPSRRSPVLKEDSPSSLAGQTMRQQRLVEPILPDHVDREPEIHVDDDETLRIRAVTDSSYLDKLLHRAYFRFEAYGSGGYVAGQSERFLLSRDLERDHLAQKDALNTLLEELGERGYARLHESENDWSEFVLRPRETTRSPR